MDAIRRQTRHLSRIIEDLLDISRINLGKFELRREILDANARSSTVLPARSRD